MEENSELKSISRSVRVTPLVHDIIEEMAHEDMRSWNAELIYLATDHPSFKKRMQKRVGMSSREAED